MATCRECLHFETCLNDKQQTRYYGEKDACNNVEDLCRYFLSKSDYVKRERGEWISVKDRLPDEDGEYLVFFNGEPSEMCMLNFATVLSNADEAWFVFKNKNYNGWYDWDDEEHEYYEVDGVTHWQPLPEPPKGE